MQIELTGKERSNLDHVEWYRKESTLAWRAFWKAIGAEIRDPMMVIDGDGSQFEPITRRYFYLEEAKDDRFLSLGHFGCWDGGAMRSLDPDITYVSYSVPPDGAFVDFHGWYRPRQESRIIPRGPDDPIPFLTKDGLAPMGLLVGIMRRLIARAGQP